MTHTVPEPADAPSPPLDGDARPITATGSGWPAIAPLLRAASDEHLLARAVGDLGLDRVAALVAEELAVRCDPVPVDRPARLSFEITAGRDRAARLITVDRDGLTSRRDGWQDAPVRISHDAADLLRSLYGPGTGTGTDRQTSRRVTTCAELNAPCPDPGRLTAIVGERRRLAVAVQAVVAACQRHPVDLGRLSTRFGSDKWADLHWYTQHYERHFARFRDAPIRLLEIGIGGYDAADQGGASLRMWQRYFPAALVLGLDIVPKPGVRGPRIATAVGDQGDPVLLDELGRRFGPFDIVIDDGSHLNADVRTSFAALFRHVRPGGLYVVEDLQTAYWPSFGGTAGPVAGPATSAGLLKQLIDGLHHQEWVTPAVASRPSYADRHTVALTVYHNLAFIEKGVNAEEGAPAFLDRGCPPPPE
ncbi:hypothetical protein AB0E96_29550 [Kitasatospora sp. NPDC036755]|uniref:hypothetical protein n=1 Tax=Kitasatospora sp. NPDC036755 TaxID=3154600 RepID=UPI00340498F0